jgi:phosphopantothenoylcysteine decarboxylase
MSDARTLYIIGTAAPPVRQLDEACQLAIEHGWRPCVILTPTAASWVDIERLSTSIGMPVRVNRRRPDEQDPLPPADAILAAPLTFNTINKWAAGISDTLALGLLNELLVDSPLIVAVPCAKAALRAHPAYFASVQLLEKSSVHFLDQDRISSRDADGLVVFDWAAILQQMNHLARAA